jgi:GNAT superfamily N-acetyltransferase
MKAARRATAGDAGAIAAVGVRSFRIAYRGVFPDDFLEALDDESLMKKWELAIHRDDLDVIVIENDERSAVGFCCLAASRDSDAVWSTGEITVMHVDPSHWRVGYGSGLIVGVREFGRLRGFVTITLWTSEADLRARAFYESRGFSVDGEKRVDNTTGFPVPTVRYRGAVGEAP